MSNDSTENNENETSSKKPLNDSEYKKYTNEEGQTVEENINKTTNELNYKKITLVSHKETGKTYPLGRIWINIKGETKNGIIFEDSLFNEKSFILGQNNHCLGIEMCLASMNINDHCLIYIYNEKYSYSKSCNKIPIKYKELNINNNNINEIFPLKFNVILCDAMKRIKDSHEMTFEEQLNYCNELKEKGNKRYQIKRYKTALDIYNLAIQCINAMKDIEQVYDDDKQVLGNVNKKDVKQTQETLYLNAAMYIIYIISIFFINVMRLIVLQCMTLVI